MITRPVTVVLDDRKAGKDVKLSLKPGDEWTYLTYFAEGTFLMSWKGRAYGADQDLFEASGEKPAGIPHKERPVDQLMKLTCANGATGWLLLADVEDQPGFESPRIIEYGKAADAGSKP